MPGIQAGKLYIGEDNIVFWGDRHIPNSGLYDQNLENFVNDSTVTFQLYQSDGTTAVSGASGTCSYVTGTKGVYEGVLEDGVSLTENATYILEILATSSSDRIGRRRLSLVATYHGAS